MPRKPRDEQELDETLNPNDHYDPGHGIGKHPDMAGKRADESQLDALGDDPSNLREEGPQQRAEHTPRS